MKKMKWLIILIACLLSLVPSMGVCFAEGESTAVVRYKPEYEELAPTDIKIIVSAKMSEFGAIYDGDTLLGAGETIYQLRHQETKTFRIRPSLGYDVETVTYDQENITDRLRAARSIRKEYLLEIEGKGHDAQLEVEFYKISADDPGNPDDPEKPGTPDDPDNPDKPGTPDSPDNPDNPDNPGAPDKPDNPDNPKVPAAQGTPSGPGASPTGDETSAHSSMVLAGIAGMVMLTLLYKKKRGNK